MEKINVRTDVPFDVALAHTEGKLVKSRFGGKEMMFTTIDDRVLYLNEEAGHIVQNRIRDLGVQRAETIIICRESHREGKEVTMRWTVCKARIPVGEQPDGTFVLPAQPGASASSPAPAARQVRTASQQPAQAHHSWAAFLLSQTNAMVDVYAAALNYAQQTYGEAVKPEDVRQLLTAAIAHGASARYNAA